MRVCVLSCGTTVCGGVEKCFQRTLLSGALCAAERYSIGQCFAFTRSRAKCCRWRANFEYVTPDRRDGIIVRAAGKRGKLGGKVGKTRKKRAAAAMRAPVLPALSGTDGSRAVVVVWYNAVLSEKRAPRPRHKQTTA